MTLAALIVAAGRGHRAGAGVPKQWRPLAGRRVADHTVAAFRDFPMVHVIAIVLHPEDRDEQAQFAADGLIVAQGGADRGASVRNGLDALQDLAVSRVLIHDVARPCVSPRVISDVIKALETAPGAAPALPVTDALWTGTDGLVTGTQDRTGLFRAQTPQGFHYDKIRAAHASHPGGAADDVEVARAAGLPVAIVPGDEENLKITLPADFDRADRILRARNGH